MKPRTIKIALLSTFVVLVLIQFITVSHTNPPILQEATWDSEQTKQFAKRACYDCHSNETVYPWYSYVAPISWIISNHVKEGREKLNFSEWNRKQEADEAVETVVEGEMPTKDYLLIHSDARLSKAETELFVAGLTKSFGVKAKKPEGKKD